MKRKDKEKANKISQISNIIIGSLIAVVLIVTIVVSNSKFNENKYVTFNNVDVNGYLSVLNSKDNKIVYIGRTGCGYCQKAEPIFLELMRDYNIVINKIDIANLSQSDYDKLMKSADVLESGEWQGTPFIAIAHDGKLVEYIKGYTPDKQKYIDLFKKYDIIK